MGKVKDKVDDAFGDAFDAVGDILGDVLDAVGEFAGIIAPFLNFIPVVGPFLSAATFALSAADTYFEQKDAAKKQKRARRTANAKARGIERNRSIRARSIALRRQQINRANVVGQAAASAGQGLSSPVQGGLVGNASQANTNLAFSNTIDELNRQRLSALGDAQEARAEAQQSAQQQQLFGQLYSLAG